MARILVMGGTGMLGAPSVRHLLDGGYAVRVLTRRPEVAEELFDRDVEVATGNGVDEADVHTALDGCDGVLVSVAGPGDRPSAENSAAAARDLDIGHITYVSGTTVLEENAWNPMIADKLAAERAVMECGVPWTVLCPSWCMGQLPNFLRHSSPVVIGRLETAWHWYAPEDMGRMAAATFSRPDAEGKRLFVHGPEGITVKEAVERYVAMTSPERGPVKVLPIWMAKLIGLVSRNEMLRYAADLMAYFKRVGEAGDPTEANAILGAPEITLDEWVELGKAIPA